MSPAFLISLAAASNKMISHSKPRRNFSLSFDAFVSVIDGFQFAVGVDLLSQEGKVGDLLFRMP